MSLHEANYTLNDFLRHMQQISRLGSMRSMMKLIPGLSPADLHDDEPDVASIEGMIRAMTPEEREYPGIIDHSRRCRVAKGSGLRVSHVRRLLDNFEKIRTMMRKISDMGMRERFRWDRDFSEYGQSHPDSTHWRYPRRFEFDEDDEFDD